MKKVTALLLSLILLLSLSAAAGAFSSSTGDRIIFYNIGGLGAPSGDFIIVQSDGKTGLIDTGHRYSDTITDENGREYSVAQEDGLSSQVEYKNGRDAAYYMFRSLGITHIDFIIGTHSHSDHIGGIPDIAGSVFTDNSGNTVRLVDENTVFIYKEYVHINANQDDLYDGTPDTHDEFEGDTNQPSSWHNQAYLYQAKKALRERNCKFAELSHGEKIRKVMPASVDFSDVVSVLNSVPSISGARYIEGSLKTRYDDFVMFNFGNLTLRLYNLFNSGTDYDENVNSIVTVISDGNLKCVSLADINVEYKAEQKIAKEIYDDIGTADLLKIAHHGAQAGSNAKETLDLLRPKNAVVTRSKEYAYGTELKGSFAAATMYAKKNFDTVFYEVGASDFGIVAEFTGEGFEFSNLVGTDENARLESPENCISTIIPENGWNKWTVEWTTKTYNEYYYFYWGEIIPNWYEDAAGRYYYMDVDSTCRTGWQEIGGKWYYFSKTSTDKYPYGAMYTGWEKIGGKWYFFDEKGRMAVEWQMINGKWYYFGTDGAMRENWVKFGDSWYYFGTDGAMKTGPHKVGEKTYLFDSNGHLSETDGWYMYEDNWYYISGGTLRTGWVRFKQGWRYFGDDGMMRVRWGKANGKWYYFDEDGIMQTGWQEIGEKWYYFDGNGVMCTGWLEDNGGWYYFLSSGEMKTGWMQSSGYWFYFTDSGRMATGTRTINGREYTFNENGAWVK